MEYYICACGAAFGDDETKSGGFCPVCGFRDSFDIGEKCVVCDKIYNEKERAVHSHVCETCADEYFTEQRGREALRFWGKDFETEFECLCEEDECLTLRDYCMTDVGAFCDYIAFVEGL